MNTEKKLQRRGRTVNHKKVRRLQRKFGLFPVSLRRFVRTTDSRHSHKIYPNLLKGYSPPKRLNEVCLGCGYNLCSYFNGFCVCGGYYGFLLKEDGGLGGCFVKEYGDLKYPDIS